MIEFIKKLLCKPRVCRHEYQPVDEWSSDALGDPYGYRIYKCKKCLVTEKRFWYI